MAAIGKTVNTFILWFLFEIKVVMLKKAINAVLYVWYFVGNSNGGGKEEHSQNNQDAKFAEIKGWLTNRLKSNQTEP